MAKTATTTQRRAVERLAIRLLIRHANNRAQWAQPKENTP